MYAVINSHLDTKSQTVYYSSLSGKYAGQQLQCGIEERSTVLRGVLLAVLQALHKLEGLFGTTDKHTVDVLIENEEIAEQLRSKFSISKVLHADNDELFSQLIAKKAVFNLRFITSHGESEYIKTIWRWSSVPPLPAELPSAV